MMVLSHAMVGAAFGEALDSPVVVFFLMIILHLIMDKIPHFWPKTKKAEVVFMITDTVLCGLFLLWILIFQPTNYVSVFAGAFGGILIDVIFVGIPQVKKSKYGRWQESRQPHVNKKVYLATDFIAIILGAMFLFK